MGIKVAVARFSNPTTSINQDITTTDLGGLTPKAAIIIGANTQTDGTVAGFARMCVGITDGTNHAVTSWGSRTSQTTSETANINNTNQVFTALGSGAGTAVFAEAQFVSWITNGIRIFWNDPTSTVYLHTIIFFAGSDLSVKVGTFEASGPNNTETTVTTTFAPNDIFFMSGGDPFDDTMRGGVWQQLGLAHNAGGTIQQGSIAHYHGDAQSGAVNSGIIQNDRISANLNPTMSREFELSAFLSDGFKVKHHEGVNSTSQWHAYLALNYGGKANSYVGTKASPTSTGNSANTSPGIEPQFVMLMPTTMPALNTLYEDNTVVSYAISNITSTQEHSLSVADEDGASTTDTESLLDDVSIRIRNAIGTANVLVANRVSFDSNGYTLNYTTADATAHQMLVWVVGAEITVHTLTISGFDAGTPSVQSVSLGQIHGLSAGSISTGDPAIQNVAIAQKHTLSASALSADTPVIQSVALAFIYVLSAGAINSGSPSLQTVAISQKHTLTATELISGQPTLQVVLLGQKHSLTVAALSSGTPTLQSVALSQTHALTIAALSSGTPTLQSVALGQTHILSAAAISTGAPTIQSVSIGAGSSDLDVGPITTGAPTIQTVALGVVVNLSAGAITSGTPTIQSVALGQKHTLTISALSSGSPTIQIVSLSVKNNLLVGSIDTGQPTIQSVALTQQHVLLTSGVTAGAPTLQNVALSQLHSLLIGALSSGAPTLQAVTLGQQHTLIVASVDTGQPAISTVALGQTHVLSVAAITTGVPTIAQPTLQVSFDITTGVPTIEQPTLRQTHALQSEPIVSGEPTVAITALLQQHILSAGGITTGPPSLSVATISQTHHLAADGITTAAPTITFILFFEVPKERTIVVEAEQRIVYIYKDVRTLAVDSEERGLYIETDSRTVVAEKEERF